jgi:hypothetical protein
MGDRPAVRIIACMTVLHVTPTALGKWHVQRHGDAFPLSEHGSATEAEREARESGAEQIVVRDRYGRVRVVHP